MRQCRACKKYKDKGCFYKNAGNSTGYSRQCKACSRTYAVKRRKDVRDDKVFA